MAYAGTPVLKSTTADGVRTWEIAESEIGTSSEWSISDLPKEVTVSLFTSHLTVAGSASTIQPALGFMAGWTIGANGSVTQAAAADADHTIVTKVRAYLPEGVLYGKSTPDTGTGATGRVVTRISIEPGHAE